MKTYQEINEKIGRGEAVVMTAEEVIDLVDSRGAKEAAKEVDVVTTGTFGAMCSSGAFLNFGHSEPPIKMQKLWLNGVPAYTGIAAVDAYIGATELKEEDNMHYGGAHVIEDLISGKVIALKATSYGTDCYPRREIETSITLDLLNQAFLFNPRNAYQNYAVATNSSDRILFTYMGKLLPNYGNATYSNAGQLSPLMNDPQCRTIGIGTRIFLGGGTGYVSWEGTQFSTAAPVRNGIPTRPSRCLAVIGDLKEMNTQYLRALTLHGYGISLAVGMGVPIPILDEDMAKAVAIKDQDIFAPVFDYSVQSRDKKVLKEVSYAELRSGNIELFGKEVKTSSLSSYYKAREIAKELKSRIERGEFLLSEPVQPLPKEKKTKPLEIRSREGVRV